MHGRFFLLTRHTRPVPEVVWRARRDADAARLLPRLTDAVAAAVPGVSAAALGVLATGKLSVASNAVPPSYKQYGAMAVAATLAAVAGPDARDAAESAVFKAAIEHARVGTVRVASARAVEAWMEGRRSTTIRSREADDAIEAEWLDRFLAREDGAMADDDARLEAHELALELEEQCAEDEAAAAAAREGALVWAPLGGRPNHLYFSGLSLASFFLLSFLFMFVHRAPIASSPTHSYPTHGDCLRPQPQSRNASACRPLPARGYALFSQTAAATRTTFAPSNPARTCDRARACSPRACPRSFA